MGKELLKELIDKGVITLEDIRDYIHENTECILVK